jgi:hypothetical protein
MLRRLFLVGVLVVFRRGSITQLIIAVVFCAVFLTVQMQVSAASDPRDLPTTTPPAIPVQTQRNLLASLSCRIPVAHLARDLL